MTLGCHLLQCTPSHTLASNVNPSHHNTRGGMTDCVHREDIVLEDNSYGSWYRTGVQESLALRQVDLAERNESVSSL